MNENNNLTIRNATIMYRNFSGREREFNPAGRRNFSVLIEDPQFAETLMGDGWRVKPLKKRSPDEEPHWHLPVAVVYDKYPPKVYQICGDRCVLLNEQNVGNLDWADIRKVDLTVHPSKYSVAGSMGVKAYLRTMYVTIEQDELDDDYARYFDNEEMPF